MKDKSPKRQRPLFHDGPRRQELGKPVRQQLVGRLTDICHGIVTTFVPVSTNQQAPPDDNREDNEFELAIIIDRMQECRQQNAARGELYDHIATGYVLRSGVFGKHPDDRVQRAVAIVFDQFDRSTSVRTC